jgi:hypothetical protein
MSYVNTSRPYYEQFQIDTPLEEGTMGWSRAPWPGWGQNANLIGPKQIAVGSSPDGLGAYYRNQENRAIGQDAGSGGGALVVVMFACAVVGGLVLLGSMREIGKQPRRR